MLQNIKCSILGTNTPYVFNNGLSRVDDTGCVCVKAEQMLGLHFGRPKYKNFPPTAPLFVLKIDALVVGVEPNFQNRGTRSIVTSSTGIYL